MIVGIDMGHSVTGTGTGANGIISEVGQNRKIGNRLIQMLREKAVTVINCTVDVANSVNEQLNGIVAKANAQALDLFVSIHLNSGGGVGTEIFVMGTGGKSEGYANKILAEVVGSCGFRNRGLKTANFCVLRATNAPAVLLEVCFVDSQEDANKLNVEAVAKAMFKGITGTDYVGNGATPAPKPVAVVQPVSQGNDWVRRLQAECNAQKCSNQVVDGIAGSSTLAGCPTLKQGAKGNITRLLQEKLVSLGYSTNGIDGVFGAGTYKAVVAFQRNKGLGADGVAGRNTWARLLGL